MNGLLLPADDRRAKPPLAGIVVDPAGSPVAEAKVWLVGNIYRAGSNVIQATQTDAAGRFTLDDPARDGDAMRRAGLVVRDAGGRLGGASLPPAGDPTSQEIRIFLVQTHDYQGRLVDTGGRPIADVLVRPDQLMAAVPGTPKEPCLIGLIPEIVAEIGGQTANDGSFMLRGVPVEGNVTVMIITPESGSTCVSLNLGEPVTIRLGRAGSVSGRLTGREPDAAADVKLTLFTTFSVEEPQHVDYHVSHRQETRTGKDGSFQFSGVPPGHYRISAALDDKSPCAAFGTPCFRVKPGERTANIALELCRMITVRGKVIDRQTRAGVSGVNLQFYTRPATPGRDLTQEAKTDAQGEYSVRLLPGKICGYVSACPADYTVPDPELGLRQEPRTADSTWPVIELERGTSIEGVVVDESGQAVANAEVRFCRAAGRQIEKLNSDRIGQFVVKQLAGEAEIRISARTDLGATTEPLAIAPGKTKGPVRLVLSQARAGAIRGAVVDDVGQQVPRAAVSIGGYWQFGPRRDWFEVVSLRCDDQGRFEVRGLWPDVDYRLQVFAEGFELHEETAAKPLKGETLDLGRIVLDGARIAIEGMVVDSVGNSVPGVRVVNSGDAPKRRCTSTDAAGRFRLQGFCAGAVYLFAEKQTYRFQTVLAGSGDADVRIQLLRSDEPLPPRSPSSRLSEDEQRALVRPLVERLWTLGDQVKRTAAVLMAFLDPPKAAQWSKELDSPYHQEIVQAAAAMKRAATDLDAALAMLPVGSRSSADMLKSMAERFVDESPAKARRCAEERLALARELTNSERAEILAWAGGLMARLGQEETARSLSMEAAEIAAILTAVPRSTHIRGKVAARVATFDLKRAVALLEPIGDQNQRSPWLAKIAAAASVNDPDEARALWKTLDPIHLNNVRVWTALRLAETCVEDALQMTESLDGDNADSHKVEALGWIAESTARRDQALACSLIDRALELAMAPPTGNCSRPYEEMPAQAALQAVHAQRIGYPDFPSVVARVLAARPPLGPYPAWAIQGSLGLALVLALADPEAAGQLLRVLEPRLARLGAADTLGRTKSDWCKAWAVADPRYAIELAERELAAGSKDPNWDIGRSGVGEVAWLLTVPRSECQKFLGCRVNLTPPGQ